MTQAIRPAASQSPEHREPQPTGGSGQGDSPDLLQCSEDKARFFDYREAANPVRKGLTEPIGYRQWGSSTSSLFYVLQGQGQVDRQASDLGKGLRRPWSQGDLFVLPAGAIPTLSAETTSVLYWVHDGPLLSYLGVKPSEPRFQATFYGGERLEQELTTLMEDPSSQRSNRLSILLANADLPASRTVSHTLWAMYGAVRAGSCQPPHRHQSVAIDLIIDSDPGCYTLVGKALDENGAILNPTRIDWEPGGVFVTPPGHWHAHVNESGRVAHLLPIQDAGLHTYLRSLDIRFTD